MDVSRTGIIRPNRVLLATDGSPSAALAARVAVELARRTGAELHVAHAWRMDKGFGYPTMVLTEYSHVYEREARGLLEAEIGAIEGMGGAVAEPHLLHAAPIDAILDLCEELEPGLLIMGSRGLGPVGRLVVGSVAEGVVHHSPCPVLVVRGGEEAWPPQRVVIGDDGSEGAWRTTGLAGGIGGLFGAEVVLVRAHRNPPEPIGGWSAKDRRRLDEMRAREEEVLGRRADDLGRLSGNRPETKVIEADATLALLLAAEEGEGRKTLLAVGSRGLGLVGRVRLGSVSINVLRVAEGPVLICPPPREAAVQADRATVRSAHPAQTAP